MHAYDQGPELARRMVSLLVDGLPLQREVIVDTPSRHELPSCPTPTLKLDQYS
jgi:hypothetical protein